MSSVTVSCLQHPAKNQGVDHTGASQLPGFWMPVKQSWEFGKWESVTVDTRPTAYKCLKPSRVEMNVFILRKAQHRVWSAAGA